MKLRTIQKFSRLLDLKYPVKVKFSREKNRFIDAEYWPELSDSGKARYHRIIIYHRPARSIKTLIAHELIHAWQYEHGKTEIHGKHFRRLARKFKQRYNLREVYIPRTDLE